MSIPMPILDKPIWSYNDEKYRRMKLSSYINKKDRTEAFKFFVSSIESMIKAKECNMTFDKNKMNAQLKTSTDTVIIKYIEMSTSIETPIIGEYAWLDQDFFSVHKVGKDECLMFDAFDVKNRNYSKPLSNYF